MDFLACSSSDKAWSMLILTDLFECSSDPLSFFSSIFIPALRLLLLNAPLWRQHHHLDAILLSPWGHHCERSSRERSSSRIGQGFSAESSVLQTSDSILLSGWSRFQLRTAEQSFSTAACLPP